MLVRADADSSLVLVTQEEHAALSGEIAARLVDLPPPRAALIAAARVHDNGWREPDARPLLYATTGRPISFYEMPHAPYRALWAKGVSRAVELDAYTALLVMLHAARFFARSDDHEHQRFHADLAARGDALLAQLGMGGTFTDPPPDIARQHAWLGFCDAASLVACGAPAWARQARVGDTLFQMTPDPDGIRISPWPFDEPFDGEVRARRLPQAHFLSQASLDAAWARSEPVVERVRFMPA